MTKNKIEFLLNILVFIQQRSREYKETYINKGYFLFKSKLNLQEMCVNLVHLELLVHHWKCILCHQSHYWPLVKHEHFFRGIKKLCSWVVVYYLCFQLSSSIIVDSSIKQNRNLFNSYIQHSLLSQHVRDPSPLKDWLTNLILSPLPLNNKLRVVLYNFCVTLIWIIATFVLG